MLVSAAMIVQAENNSWSELLSSQTAQSYSPQWAMGGLRGNVSNPAQKLRLLPVIVNES